jgi:anhydro-N-acetylmuramic acid kinase
MNHYHVAGLMSGTSMDGVDIACCYFREENGRWEYTIVQAGTIPYPEEWKIRLQQLPLASAMELAHAHADYGHYLGKLTHNFLKQNKLEADLVASHGHTIFHQPQLGFTCQIGDGAAIAAECNLPVIADFRSLDVALGGQGAPLVPLGDQLLFSEYDSCLNIGGFANISCDNEGRHIAYDICPANIILNYLSEKLGQPYDRDGLLAASGHIDENLLHQLDHLEYYRLPPPKSLGREWVESAVLPLLNYAGIPVYDALRTVTEHIALQLAKAIGTNPGQRVLITGGGAFNTFMMQRLAAFTQASLVIPEPLLVNFKEALVFGLLGALRLRGEPNCLAVVTGARENAPGGAFFLPPKKRE